MSFTFGAPSSAPASSGLTGFSFANKPTTPGFGLTTSQPSTGLFGNTTSSAPAFGGTSTFGATSTPAFGAATTPAFGTTATPAFGTTATPAFGATTTSAFGATTTPAFGTGLNFGTGTNTAQSTGLSFAQPTTLTSTGLGGLGGFGFGAQTTVTQNDYPNFLPGISKIDEEPHKSFHIMTPSKDSFPILTPRTRTPSLGLGGVGTAPGIGVSSTTADGKEQQPKQTKLPNELSTTIDTFKEFVKKQKSLSSDIKRVSINPLHKVSREAEQTLRAVVSLSSDVNKSRVQSRRLRAATADALAAAEQAARNITGSELETTAPPLYVKELLSELEQQLITFRRQMDIADKQMQATPKLLSEQELSLGIRRMHESLVALAGRLQAVHSQVEMQKEQYLNLRKYILKDNTDVFATQTPSNSLDQILRDAESNRKKTINTRQALGNIQQLAGPSPFTYVGHTLSPFSTGDASGVSWQQQPQSVFGTSFNMSGVGVSGGTTTETPSTSFQLQKPPKRGKQ
ncbi:Probable nucleoporin Nup58 [Eumeta japonica]|uniref:Probable nucleoporin Nup58 n=1 Tax=Eumeta variegata TaxID=151549 RepID=A0A4C1TRM4_EUMVA|nr:Probable nucleoporin Nup58 [Eumeta japonica]